MTFEEFVKKHYPFTVAEYERSKMSWDDLVPGTVLITVRPGFAGKLRMVTDEHEKTDKWDDRSMIKDCGCHRHPETDDWWRYAVPIDLEKYRAMSWRERWDYVDDLAKGRIVN
jgi:hypothetical protein